MAWATKTDVLKLKAGGEVEVAHIPRIGPMRLGIIVAMDGSPVMGIGIFRP